MSGRPVTRSRGDAGAVTTRLVSAEDRFAHRGRRDRRRAWLRGLGFLLVVAAVAGVAWVVLVSPVLGVRTVVVTGVPRSEVDRIRAEAEVASGTPLARLDTGALADRVAADPLVAHVSVRRSLPGTVTIRVTLRRPVLAVRSPQGVLSLVDVEGVPFRTVDRAPAGLPVVHSSSQAPVPPDGVQAAVSMVSAVTGTVTWRPTDLQVGSAGLLSFSVRSTQVVWGSADHPRLKVEIIAALLKKHPRLIDVSAPDTPVTR